jgi:antitoxin PrlF
MAKRTKARSRLTSQGQISIPAPVRELLGLTAGSVVEWDATEDQVVVRRAGGHTSTDVHDAMFTRPPAQHDLRELKDGIRRHVKRRHARD